MGGSGGRAKLKERWEDQRRSGAARRTRGAVGSFMGRLELHRSWQSKKSCKVGGITLGSIGSKNCLKMINMNMNINMKIINMNINMNINMKIINININMKIINIYGVNRGLLWHHRSILQLYICEQVTDGT